MTPSAAAIYARISSDREGDALGVERQLVDCRALAESRGWVVAQEYVDNDQSAYRGKRRPEYERMMEDLKDGFIDAVVVWHLDRLTRSPAELESFFHAMSAAGDPPMASVTGDYDLSTHDGQFHARILGAVAKKESDDKSRRLRRKHQELAEAGKVSGGGTRPFGFEADRVTIRPDEAAIIREIADRLLAGDSKASICRDLEARGITTPKGNTWKVSGLGTVMTSARIAGMREHKGELCGTAQWPAIITPEVSARLRSAGAARAASGSRSPRRYLLAGMGRCSLCEAVLVSRPRPDGTRRYVCSTSVGHGGCGKIAIVAEPVEELISEAVLYRLDSPAVAATLAGSDADSDAQAATARAELEADLAQLEELATAYGTRDLSMAEWSAAKAPIGQRIKANEKLLGRLTRTTAVTGFVGNASELRALWSDLTLQRQQAIIKAVLDHFTISPQAKRGSTRFEPDRVTPTWRI